MADADIPPEVQEFVARHIASVMGLELLLFLRGHAGREWTADAAARELRSNAAWASTQLEEFAARGLLSRTPTAGAPTYRAAPLSAEPERTLNALAALYAQKRVRVVSLIFSTPADKVQTFADAFRFRKDKPDG